MTLVINNINQDAIHAIQETLKKEDHKPYFIRRTYLPNGSTTRVITKSYFSEYRKPPTFKKTVLRNLHIQDKIKFVYKYTDKNHITKIIQNQRGRLRQKIKI